MFHSQYFLHLIGSSGIAWVIGIMWYSPLMFGKVYAQAIASNLDKVHSVPAIFSQFVTLLVLTYIADILLLMFGVDHFGFEWLKVNALLIAFTLAPLTANSIWRSDKALAWQINAIFMIIACFSITFLLLYLRQV